MALPTAREPTEYGNGAVRLCRRGKQGNILLVALSRPHVKNALNDDLYNDLNQVLHHAKYDDSVAAVVFTGTGSYFCSGADLSENDPSPLEHGRHTLQLPSGRFMLDVIAFPKLLCAAVQGPVVGVAFSMVMLCDLVYCTDKATFWAPFTRLALIPEMCSAVTLVETMGRAKANEIMLLGKKVDAATALQWNICSRVVPNTALEDPFDSKSLASYMCNDLDQKLFALPLGNDTARVFVECIRGGERRGRLLQACCQELIRLDERFDTGQVQEASLELMQTLFGNKKSKL